MERRLNEVEWSHTSTTTNSGLVGRSNGLRAGQAGPGSTTSVNSTSVTNAGSLVGNLGNVGSVSTGGLPAVCSDLFPTNDIDGKQHSDLSLSFSFERESLFSDSYSCKLERFELFRNLSSLIDLSGLCSLTGLNSL